MTTQKRDACGGGGGGGREQETPSLSEADALHYLEAWTKHQRLVGAYLTQAVTELMQRATVHDHSKLTNAKQFAPYVRGMRRFETTAYGTPEYQAACDAIAPAIRSHVLGERHHPEFWGERKPHWNLVNLFDLVEMVCDWMAAALRGAVGVEELKMDLQKARFQIPDALYDVMCNTAMALNEGELSVRTETPAESADVTPQLPAEPPAALLTASFGLDVPEGWEGVAFLPAPPAAWTEPATTGRWQVRRVLFGADGNPDWDTMTVLANALETAEAACERLEALVEMGAGRRRVGGACMVYVYHPTEQPDESGKNV